MSLKGDFRLRMPPALHAHLSAQAAEQGVSLNRWMLVLLAGGSGFKLDEEGAA
jgi:predicted HicB family RNase H-like nuclease